MAAEAPSVTTVIQARMSSRRFPGKVLARLAGKPIIAHVIDRVRRVPGFGTVVVATSADVTDDPLAAYVESLNVATVRGPLQDVFSRFRMCASRYPSQWILRVSADSPLLDPAVVERVIAAAADEWDLVTTIFPRTFPKGQNAELIQTRALESIGGAELGPEDREHVTPYLYRHPGRFKILNIESGDPALADTSMAVDTPEDLERLEAMLRSEEPSNGVRLRSGIG